MKNLFTLFLFILGAFAVNGQSTVLSETFEGTGIPSGWTQSTSATDGGWKFGTTQSVSSSSWGVPNTNATKVAGTNDDACNCNKSKDYLITPPMDFTTSAAFAMSFDSYFGAFVYDSYEAASVEVSTDGGATWDVVYELPGNDAGWDSHIVNLSDYAGNAQVWVAFHYNDDGGWAYGWAIDNVQIFTPAANDAGISRINTPRFVQFGTDVAIEGQVTNYGADNLTSFDLNWSDGVNTYIDQITGIDVPYLGTYDFSHTATLPLPQPVSYNYMVSVSNPNNAVDADPTNDATNAVVSGVTYIPHKKMFAEEATGTWCGWCPRGAEWMDYMAEFYPDDFVGVAVHNGDPMVVTAYDNGVGDFPGFSGYPSVIVERKVILDPSGLENALPAAVENVVPVSPAVEATLDVATKTLNVTGSAEFVTALDNIDYRLNIVMTESNVTGTGSGYNQANYYSGSATLSDPIPDYGTDYINSPNPIPAANMVYHHVARVLSDGWDGAAGSVPSSVIAGDVATHEYNNTNFNTNWNPFNMHAIVMVLDNATGEALNVEETEVEVICPADLGANITVTDATQGSDDGVIVVAMDDNNFGFGGYTFSLNSGQSANAGNAIENLPAGDYVVTVADKIGCSQEFNVTIESTVAIEDIESLTSFSMSPNPASSFAQINARFGELVDARIDIINAAGQLMEQVQFDRTADIQHTLDLANYAEGIYMVKVAVGNQIHTENLIVTR